MLKRLAVALVAAFTVVVTVPAQALAGGGAGAVQCHGQGCSLFAGTPGSPGHPGRASLTGTGGGQGSGPDGNCYIPASGGGLAAFAIPGCPGQLLSMLAGLPPALFPVLAGQQPAGPGLRALAAPAVLARAAESRLALPSPVIRANPPVGRDQLVRLPTWLWLAGPWQPVSATAAVPGESVTATATPRQVTWDMGDGAMVVCHGPGTPYPPSGDPAAASPDCGHTYTRGSAHAPGGAYRLSATITWDVTWAGGGAAGTFPGLATTASAAMRVAESHAIVTGTTP